ncbi:Hypothetical protein R9X50_00469700 [Acrodontium crateriforme]|uniref:Uncharacterized protein n=1 Tax=Acrodontium crateriforme TaxID=150365 RepID=A0AAQ3RCX1_9PEZI|nr:Hypothetical protein R9X50_00469700 [Acrodontium crateriforme]
MADSSLPLVIAGAAFSAIVLNTSLLALSWRTPNRTRSSNGAAAIAFTALSEEGSAQVFTGLRPLCCAVAVVASLSAGAETITSSNGYGRWILLGATFLVVAQCCFAFIAPSKFKNALHHRLVALSAVLTAVIQAALTYHAFSPDAAEQGLKMTYAKATATAGRVLLYILIAVAYSSVPQSQVFLQNGRPVDPDSCASDIGRLSFAWAAPILRLAGQRVSINVSSLPSLSSAARSAVLAADLHAVRALTKQPLWRSIYYSHRHLFWLQWSLTVLTSILSFAPLVATYHIVKLLEEDHSRRGIGTRLWIWAAAAGALSFILQILTPRMMYLTFAKIEIYVRAQLSAAIFNKALNLENSAGDSAASAAPRATKQPRQSTESAASLEDEGIPMLSIPDNAAKAAKPVPPQPPVMQQIPNFIGVDTNRVAEISSRQHIFIGSLSTFLIALVFLIRLIGWTSFLCGLIGPLIIVPLNMRASMAYGGAQVGIMMARDDKLKILSQTLRCIKQIKLTASEDQWEAAIMTTRKNELAKQRTSFFWAVWLRFLFHASPILLAMISLSVYARLNGSLSAAVAFTALGVFANLEFSISVLPMAFMQLVDGSVSAGRLGKFLDSAERKPYIVAGAKVRFTNATIAWPGDHSNDATTFRLRKIDATFEPHTLNVIHGPSGSGKSLLLASIAGEATLVHGTITAPKPIRSSSMAPFTTSPLEDWILPGTMAYVPQTPWIQNDSIQRNILFGLPMDENRYNDVLDAAALRPDLRILVDGDLTEVGAQGINLSGGQRWRLTFARALYSRAEILVLDDIFSAVDAHTGAHLYRTLTGPLCTRRTRILATHHVSMSMAKAAMVIKLGEGGCIDSVNSYETKKYLVDDLDNDIVDGKSSVDPMDHDNLNQPRTVAAGSQRPVPQAFVQEETREEGAVKWRTYRQYMSASGGLLTWTLAVGLVAISQLTLLGRAWWIEIWTADSDGPGVMASQDTAQPSSTRSLMFYLGIYIAISISTSLSEAVKSASFYVASLKASSSLFGRLLHTVLRAKLRWLDTVPLGRMINRFTSDSALMDTKIPGDAHTLLSAMFAVGVIFMTGLRLSPYLVISSAVVLLVTFWFARRYLPAAREVRRLESINKSPIFELCNTTLRGIETIRAYDVADQFTSRMAALVDDYSSSGQASHLVTQWLAVRLGVLGSMYILSVAITVAAVPSIGAPAAGLALAFAMDYAKNVEEAVRRYSMLQLDMNSTERILEYADMDHEREDSGIMVPSSWPSNGHISFDGVFATYANDLSSVLKGITFQLQPHQRVGIVGRTGAGKSTLALVLFRLLELTDGKISIDGVDISRVGLKQLRSRMAIIPQDPTIFGGTIRSNLDPHNQFNDRELRESLERVHLVGRSHTKTGSKVAHSNIFDNLDSTVADDGLNLSQGQKQLLCLARALLTRSRIIVMDEATSAVDYETDEIIQSSLRSSFLDSLLLVIAHRITTIADFDHVLVLDDGRVVESGSPTSLMGKGGVFSKLVHDSSERDQVLNMLSSR